MAKWIQLQAQLALRLQQQQSDNLDENNKTHQGCSSSSSSIPSSSTCTTPLDFSLKSSPSHSSLASLASLMMESSPSSSSAAATAAAGMTALHKMTQLASSQRSHGVSPNRFQSSLPMLSLPYKPLPWQSRYTNLVHSRSDNCKYQKSSLLMQLANDGKTSSTSHYFINAPAAITAKPSHSPKLRSH